MIKQIVVAAAVEGIVDEAVVRRLITDVGAIPGAVHGKNGKPHLRQRMRGYINAARHAPWIILVDLDRDADCAPPLRHEWLPEGMSDLCFRIAVRAVESWLLADRECMASFLSVACQKIPSDSQALSDPKATVVKLARQSRRREIREDMVPRPGSGRPVGAAYSLRLIEFTSTHWRPGVALKHCDSLRRAIECLRRITRECSRRRDA